MRNVGISVGVYYCVLQCVGGATDAAITPANEKRFSTPCLIKVKLVVTSTTKRTASPPTHLFSVLVEQQAQLRQVAQLVLGDGCIPAGTPDLRSQPHSHNSRKARVFLIFYRICYVLPAVEQCCPEWKYTGMCTGATPTAGILGISEVSGTVVFSLPKFSGCWPCWMPHRLSAFIRGRWICCVVTPESQSRQAGHAQLLTPTLHLQCLKADLRLEAIENVVETQAPRGPAVSSSRSHPHS